MRAQPVDLIGGFYTDDSLPWSCQDTVNWLPVMAEVAGTRTVSMFATPPGLKPYQQIGTGPIRGMHDCEGLRLIVSGRYLYRISNAGVGIPLGLIPGVGRVQMTHNQFKTGYQVLVENGQGGGGYVYNTVDDTFAKITDEGYPGSISSDYLDSYLLGVEPLGRFWFHSNLADATDYNTLDRYEAEAAPDKIVGLAVSQFEVVVFGQRTIEFFFNAGGQTGTFQNRRQSITRGCASRHTIQKLDNTLFWLGDDGVVYRMEGYAARPVSTRALEKAISGYNWAEAIAFTWEDRGHKVYYLTFPDGQTFGYDVVTGLWHRRESFGINRWRLSHTQKWGRDWFGGDFQDGRIWQLDWDYFLEGDQPIISERASGVIADNQSALLLPNAELIFDTGQGPATVPTVFPVQPPIPVLGGMLPISYFGQPYSYQLPVTGGTAPFSFKLMSGQLPSGFTLNASTGVISGQSSAPASVGLTIRVTDKNGLWSEKDYRFVNIGTLTTSTGHQFLDTTNSYTVPAPAGTQNGDLLIAFVSFSDVGIPPAIPVTVSAGWEQIHRDASAVRSIYIGYRKIANGSDSLVVTTATRAVTHAHSIVRIPAGQFRGTGERVSLLTTMATSFDAPKQVTGFMAQYAIGITLIGAGNGDTRPQIYAFPSGQSATYSGVNANTCNPSICYDVVASDAFTGTWTMRGTASTANDPGHVFTIQVEI